MEGTSETEDGGWWMADGAGGLPARCSFFLRQASHSPVGPGVPPQAHLRCKRLVRTGARLGDALDEVFALVWSGAFIG